MRSKLLILVVSITLGGCIFAGASSFFFTQVFWELCDDLAYRDLVVSGLGRATFAAGAIAGLLAGCGLLLSRERRIRRAILVGSLAGLLAAAAMFGFCCSIAAQVPITMVSLCWAFRPWWRAQNWILALLALLFMAP